MLRRDIHYIVVCCVFLKRPTNAKILNVPYQSGIMRHLGATLKVKVSFTQCLNFNNFLNLGFSRKTALSGGSMDKYASNGISEVVTLC